MPESRVRGLVGEHVFPDVQVYRCLTLAVNLAALRGGVLHRLVRHSFLLQFCDSVFHKVVCKISPRALLVATSQNDSR